MAGAYHPPVKVISSIGSAALGGTGRVLVISGKPAGMGFRLATAV